MTELEKHIDNVIEMRQHYVPAQRRSVMLSELQEYLESSKAKLAASENRIMSIAGTLRALSSQEGCDGEPYDTMIKAAAEIDKLAASEARVEALEDALTGMTLEYRCKCFNIERKGCAHCEAQSLLDDKESK